MIGLEVDARFYKEYSQYNNISEITDREYRSNIQEQLIQFCNNEHYRDKELLRLFFQKLNDGTLEIRKTRSPAHAKLYIFQTQEDTTKFQPGIVITGSSNLTQSGLLGQIEYNVVLEGKREFEQAREVFNTLWDDAIDILNQENVHDISKKIGLLVEPTPYEIFLKVIYEYFEYAYSDNEDIQPPSQFGFTNLQYQLDAIKQGINTIEQHDGVIIADVVGLGKSIIATSIAQNLIQRGVIDGGYVISPPNLQETWQDYLDSFSIHSIKVVSKGQLDKLEARINQMSGRNDKLLIIVDEAHSFRNEDTIGYAHLSSICAGHKVMLLSATPINNTSKDIFALVRLFQNCSRASIYNNKSIEHLITSIESEEKELRKKDSIDDGELYILSKKIVDLINPILIRRTRKDLLKINVYKDDLEKQKIQLNSVEEPIIHEYKLNALSELYTETLDKIIPLNKLVEADDIQNMNTHEDYFQASRYQVAQYIKGDTPEGRKVLEELYPETSEAFVRSATFHLSKFMRHLLVRRFESSVEAFKKTVDSMLMKYQIIQGWIEKNTFPILKIGDIPSIEDAEEALNSVEELSEKNKNLYIIKNIDKVLRKEFFDLYEQDIKILQSIQSSWKDVHHDPKLTYILHKLQEWHKENSNRKILIFSEFKDTVLYLEKELKKQGLKVISFHGSDNKAKKNEVILNFDASQDKNKQKDDYDILVTTDTLSEGINLHRAGIIVNYDIPYNPTVVIQRIGRINRIGAKQFDKLYIHNFIPRIEAQKEISNWKIANYKLALINGVLGGDTKVLHNEEDIQSVFSVKDNPYIQDGEESWDTEYRNIYEDLKNKPDLLKRIRSLPPRLELGRVSSFSGILNVHRIGNIIQCVLYNSHNEQYIYVLEEVFNYLKAEESEQYLDTTQNLSQLIKYIQEEHSSYGHHKVHNSIVRIRDFLKTHKSVLHENEYEYLENIIAYEKQIAKYTLKQIERILKNNTNDVQSLIKDMESVFPQATLKRIVVREKARQSNKHRELLVTEEFINK